MSDHSGLVLAGKVVSVYGIKGWVKVMSYTDPKEDIFSYQPWQLASADGSLEAIVVDDGREQGAGLVAHIKGVDDRDRARLYCQREILVDKSLMPPLEEGGYYWHQLIGLKVYSSSALPGQESLLGTIKQMMETGANDVMLVAPCEGSLDKRERLLPYLTGHYGLEVDLAAGRLTIDWDPEF
jgi:16S rRNA processing protein RimM